MFPAQEVLVHICHSTKSALQSKNGGAMNFLKNTNFLEFFVFSVLKMMRLSRSSTYFLCILIPYSG